MKKAITLIVMSTSLVLLSLVSASSQIRGTPYSNTDSCSGPVFSTKEVEQKARIIDRKIPGLTAEAAAHGVHGVVKLAAVFCRTGRVTDIRVIQGLPYGMTEAAIGAVRTIRFTPAELKWHAVSVKMGFEFYFNDSGGGDEIALEGADGRLIETVEVLGNRRFEDGQILKWITTRPGEVCSNAQLKRDLAAILATGYFDTAKSRVFAEAGARGGVAIIFVVVELPLISEVKFEGPKAVEESLIRDALTKEKIDLRKGMVYDTEKIQNAAQIIVRVLRLAGHPEANVQRRLEDLTLGNVALTFVISGIN